MMPGRGSVTAGGAASWIGSRDLAVLRREGVLRMRERFERGILYGCLVLFLGAHLVVPEAGFHRWWGLDVLGVHGLGLRATFLVLAILLSLPPVAGLVLGAMERGLSAARALPRARSRGAKAALPSAIALGAFLLFWCLRSGSQVWGDGSMRVTELGHLRLDWRFGGSEPLDLVLHDALFRATGWAPDIVYAVGSAVAGAAFVLLALHLPALPVLPRRSGEEQVGSVQPSWLIPGLLLTTGSMALFFGHVESYTLAQPVILGYLWTALACIRDRTLPAARLVLPAVLLMVAALLHVSALHLLPSLALLSVLMTFDRRRAPSARAVAGVALGAVLVFSAWKLLDLGRLGGTSLLSRGEDEPGVHVYGLLSLDHAVDVANFVLLLSPLPTIALVAGARRGLRAVRAGKAVASDVFLAVAAASALALLLGLDPRLGSRDWDLMAFHAFPVALAAGALMGQWAGEAPWRARFAVSATAAALLHAAPWVLALHSPDRSLTLAERMTAEDPHHAGAGRLWLGAYLDRAGLPERALAQYELAAQEPGSGARALFGQGQVLRELGREEEGLARLREACRRDAMYIPARVVLGEAELGRGRWSRAAELFAGALRVHPDSLACWESLAEPGTDPASLRAALALERRAAAKVLPDHQVRALVGLGSALIQLGRAEEAVRYLREAVAQAPQSPLVHLVYANALVGVNPPLAAEELRTALRLDPGSAEIHFRLATVLEVLGRAEEARGEFRRVAVLAPAKAGEFCRIGSAALAQGRAAEAGHAYATALDLEPDLGEALVGLARVHLFQGDVAAARDLLRRVSAADPFYAEACTLTTRLGPPDR